MSEEMVSINNPPLATTSLAGRPKGNLSSVTVVSKPGGGVAPPQPTVFTQKAWDTVDNRWYYWKSAGAPDTAGASYPGSDPIAPSKLILV